LKLDQPLLFSSFSADCDGAPAGDGSPDVEISPFEWSTSFPFVPSFDCIGENSCEAIAEDLSIFADRLTAAE